MKKSTLITTIAMIVVVVVALSTATYAWFSSATTTSVQDSISTTAQANWIIMGGKQTSSNGTDTVTYSSSNAIQLTMLDGLYSPVAAMSAKPSNASNQPTFTTTKFYKATQDGTGLVADAKSAEGASYDPIDEGQGQNIPSAANYIRVINTRSTPQDLYLTVTVITDGGDDSDFIAANAFSTYIGWTVAPVTANDNPVQGKANTRYFYGDCATTTTGSGQDVYYQAHRDGEASVDGVTYLDTIDVHNFGMRAGNWADPRQGYLQATAQDPVTIGGEPITSGFYYQFYIKITDDLPMNNAVNIAFYAWFDGWALDNTGANSQATVYYEFGENIPTRS